jgi:hypothetical protein
MPVFLCLFYLTCLFANSSQAALQSDFTLQTFVKTQQGQELYAAMQKVPQIVEQYSTFSTDYTTECQDIFKQLTQAPGFHESLNMVDEIITQDIAMDRDKIAYITQAKGLNDRVDRSCEFMQYNKEARELIRKNLTQQDMKTGFCVELIRAIQADINRYKVFQELLKSFRDELKHSGSSKSLQIFTVFQTYIAQKVNEECVNNYQYMQLRIAQGENLQELTFSDFPRLLQINKLLKPYRLPIMDILEPQFLKEDHPIASIDPLHSYSAHPMAYSAHHFQEIIGLINNHFKNLPQQVKTQILPDVLSLTRYRNYLTQGVEWTQLKTDEVHCEVPRTIMTNRVWNQWVVTDALVNLKLLMHKLLKKPEFTDVVVSITQGQQKDKNLPQVVKELDSFDIMIKDIIAEIKAGLAKLSLQSQTSEATKTVPQVLETSAILEAKSDPLIAQVSTPSVSAVDPQTTQQEDPKSGLEFGAAPLGLSENNNNPQKLEVVPEKAIQVKPSISQVKPSISEDIIRLIEGWKWIFKQRDIIEDIFTFKAKIDFQEFCGFLVKCGGSIETDKGGSHGKVMIPKGQSVRYNPGSHTLSAHAFTSVSFPIVRGHLGDNSSKVSQLSKLFARQFLSNIGMTPTDIKRLEGFVKANKVFGIHAPLTK